MGKFNKYLKSLKIILLALYAGSSFAGNLEPSQAWEFSGQNQPDYETLWDFDGQFFDLTCKDRLDVMYENYARLHPEFRRLMADRKLRKKWRYSLITKGSGRVDSLNHCFYSMLRDRWFEVTRPGNKKTILYCGKLAEGLAEIDQYGALAIAELSEYAIIGRSLPITTLLRANSKDERIRLNNDVQYYLQLHLRKFMDAKPPISRELVEMYEPILDPNAGEDLTPEYRKFLGNAFERGDHRAVLDATAPCQSA